MKLSFQLSSNKDMYLNSIFKLLFISIIISSCNSSTPNKNKTIEKEPEQKEAPMVVKSFLDTQCQLGEGAIWNAQTGELYFIDIEGRKLFTFKESTKKLSIFDVGERIGTVVPTQDPNKVIIPLQNGIFEFDLKSKEKTLFSNPEEKRTNNRMNDGKCDPIGRLWVGSMHLDQIEGAASLYKIESDGNFETMIEKVTISNGIAWSLDESKMYYIDTPTGQVQAFDYDRTSGKIINGKPIITVPESMGYPDGMTIDSEGMLWIALWNGNAVTRWNPNTGELISKIEVPAHNVSSCAFGGENLETLYITSARVDMTEEEKKKWPQSGNVFEVKPGVAGVKAFHFNKKRS